MKTNIHYLSYLAHVFLVWEMFLANFLEEIKKHILCSVNFLFFENHTVNDIIWKNIVEWGWPHMAMWRMHIACWITKATHTHTRNM